MAAVPAELMAKPAAKVAKPTARPALTAIATLSKFPVVATCGWGAEIAGADKTTAAPTAGISISGSNITNRATDFFK